MKKVFPILIMFLLSSCSTCKVAMYSPIHEIQFGSGGGFAGEITTYNLKADGSLWRQEQRIKKLSCDSLSAIYELVEQLPKEEYIHPGNAYSFIKLVYHDTTYYYTWTWANKPDQKIIELYTKLNSQL